jgi:hypothetical protein
MKKAWLIAQDISNLTRPEEIRCNILLQSAYYLQEVCRYHDRNVVSFNVGDMVLHHIQDKTGLHKLNSRCEGPFLVHKIIGPGSYRLQYPNGQLVSQVVSCGVAWSTRGALPSHF